MRASSAGRRSASPAGWPRPSVRISVSASVTSVAMSSATRPGPNDRSWSQSATGRRGVVHDVRHLWISRRGTQWDQHGTGPEHRHHRRDRVQGGPGAPHHPLTGRHAPGGEKRAQPRRPGFESGAVEHPGRVRAVEEDGVVGVRRPAIGPHLGERDAGHVGRATAPVTHGYAHPHRGRVQLVVWPSWLPA